MPTEAEIRAALAAGPLARRTEQIVALARPCVHLLTDPVAISELPPGSSRIGGIPDLPPGGEWPRWKGEPQSFIAQLDISDVAGLPGTRSLPPAGSLVFFYTARQDTWGFDPSDRKSWSVIYAPPHVDLTRTEPPEPLAEGGRFRPCAVSFRSTKSLPGPLSKEIEGLRLGPDEEDAYLEVFHALDPEDRHQLLGHPDPVQGEMTEQCELVYHGLYTGDESGWNDPRAPELRAGRSDWRLLLQVASDDAPRMMWGDAGFLYYWIRDEDLGEQAFDRAWLILQCA